MTVIISTSGELPHYDQITEVEGVPYRFRFSWNGRRARWTMSLYEADTDAPIIVGRTIVDGWPLNLRSRDARLPNGVFMAFDPAGSRVDPGFPDLAETGRTKLFFVPAEADR